MPAKIFEERLAGMKFSDGPIQSSEYGDLIIDIYREQIGYGYVITRDRKFLESRYSRS